MNVDVADVLFFSCMGCAVALESGGLAEFSWFFYVTLMMSWVVVGFITAAIKSLWFNHKETRGARK
jgi:hypothetical protein